MNMLEKLRLEKDSITSILDEYHLVDPKIFGSVARGEETEDSDIDILVTPTEKTTAIGLAGAELFLSELLERRVELVNSRTLLDIFRPHIEKDLTEL